MIDSARKGNPGPLNIVDMSNTSPESESLTRTLKDLAAGAAGGIAQVLLGQ